MKFFSALTSALAFTTAMAAPFAANPAPETNALSERAGGGIQNTGITVFHSHEAIGNGRFRTRFRMFGFLQATQGMLNVLTEKMEVTGDTSQPLERASVIAQSFFAHFVSWMDSTFPFRKFASMRALFNTGATGNAAWEGTIGAQFEMSSNEASYNKMIEALRSYLTVRGSDPVQVTFETVADAFAVGSPVEYDLPAKLKRSANVCSSTTSIMSLFQERVPDVATYFGATC
ncbi:uncharacterized protein BKCO1_280004 [Diplodia corticola]|uniref:Uncharacterized protein n=1 Tax=Diplodia corticola TaxID=236234 RepID=A0A1J9RM34_9PEZI|nr:uncharacterized protein BKCO1_280004 [Diplodia corticola]OJD33635.1 hypothetical protein BKCO1_280004 [Diplodia corticola]